MAVRKNRIGADTVTLVAGSGTVTWKDPDTVLGTQVTIQLEYAPTFVWYVRTTAGAAPGFWCVDSTGKKCGINVNITASSCGACIANN